MNNKEISDLSHEDWITYKRKNINKFKKQYPNFNFKKRLKLMIDVKNVVESFNIKVLLANGTLLGAVRDNDFIQWDDDVDLDVLAEELIPNYENIKIKLIEKGYVVRGIGEFPNMKINTYLDGEKVGILAIYEDEDIRFRASYKWPKEIYEELEEINFKDHIFKTPNINKYLLHQYGKKWKIPLKENYFNKDLFR